MSTAPPDLRSPSPNPQGRLHRLYCPCGVDLERAWRGAFSANEKRSRTECQQDRFVLFSHERSFVFVHFYLWQHCRLFGRERDKFPPAGFLLFFQVRDNGLQVVVKLFSVLVTHFAYFINDWVVPHLTPLHTLSKNRPLRYPIVRE